MTGAETERWYETARPHYSGEGVPDNDRVVNFRLDNGTEIDLTFWLPVVPDDPRDEPTPNQLGAIEQFYHLALPDLTYDLAHVLLSVRQYAKAVTGRAVGTWMDKRDVISRMTAQFILSSTMLVGEAVWASEREFDEGLEETPIDEAAVMATKAWLAEQIGDLGDEALRPLRGAIEPFEAAI